jgi:hypothetical protein
MSIMVGDDTDEPAVATVALSTSCAFAATALSAQRTPASQSECARLRT